jgi:hypothetical protein
MAAAVSEQLATSNAPIIPELRICLEINSQRSSHLLCESTRRINYSTLNGEFSPQKRAARVGHFATARPSFYSLRGTAGCVALARPVLDDHWQSQCIQ